MKKLVFTLFLAVISVMAFSQDGTEGNKGPIMTFESMTVDYGTIEQNGDPLRIVKFTNTGDEPLIITNARGSCGCTVPVWPKEPIMPGQESKIEIRYATNRIGQFSKTVRISTNEENDGHTITVKGKVLKPEEIEGVPGTEKKNPMLPDGRS